MSDLICKKTMRACSTQGMCAPYGGCGDAQSEQVAAQAAEIDSLKRERARIVMRWNSTITELDRAETQIKQLKQGFTISAVQDELNDWIHSNKIDILQRENVELRAQLEYEKLCFKERSSLLVRAQGDCVRMQLEIGRLTAIIAAAPVQAQGADDARDAVRWRMVLRRVGARTTSNGSQIFKLTYVQPVTADIMRGGVSGHFTESIDAAIAALTKEAK